MGKHKRVEYHIPRSEPPEKVLSELVYSMTLRDSLNSMEASAELITMSDEFDALERHKFLEHCSEILKRQISDIRLMLSEVKDYLKEHESADDADNL